MKYDSIYSEPHDSMEVTGQFDTLATLLSTNSPKYPLDTSFVPQSWSGSKREARAISVLTSNWTQFSSHSVHTPVTILTTLLFWFPPHTQCKAEQHISYSSLGNNCVTHRIQFIFRHVHILAKCAYHHHVCPYMHPSVHMYQLASHWADFHEIS